MFRKIRVLQCRTHAGLTSISDLLISRTCSISLATNPRYSSLVFAFWKTWFSISMLFLATGTADCRIASSLKSKQNLLKMRNKYGNTYILVTTLCLKAGVLQEPSSVITLIDQQQIFRPITQAQHSDLFAFTIVAICSQLQRLNYCRNQLKVQPETV